MFRVTNSVTGSIGVFLVYEIGVPCVSTSEASKMSSSVIGAVRFDLFKNVAQRVGANIAKAQKLTFLPSTHGCVAITRLIYYCRHAAHCERPGGFVGQSIFGLYISKFELGL